MFSFTRTSLIKDIDVKTVSFSSIFHIGDTDTFAPKAYVYAVQRELPFFWEDEGNLAYYSIYTEPIPKPIITESININFINDSPFIKVNNVKILGISTAAIAQLGSNKIINAEARTKHIRHLIRNKQQIGQRVNKLYQQKF